MMLTITKQKEKDVKLYGFDVETANNNNDFVMGCVYSDDFYQVFYNKEEMGKFMLFNDRFKGSFLVATNLQFDWCALFYNTDYEKYFRICKNGSRFIFVKTYSRYHKISKEFKNNYKAITFIDTGNYANLSVENLGKLIEIKKLKKPYSVKKCMMPRDEVEWEQVAVYNKYDAKISYKAMRFFIASFKELGATFKPTIASTSLSIFRNRFLKENYFRHKKEILEDMFKGYYGGNCHAYSRGKIEDYNLYDFNSMYPSVMLNKYPNPNTLRMNKKDTLIYIYEYEGMSKVSIYCPYMEYPLLPCKYNSKLLFPHGRFTGWYSHVELREALKLGYKIDKVHKCYWYKETCYPFKEFVEELYALRKKYEKTPMGYVIKIVLNSLYGKFGQRFDNKTDYIHVDNMTEKMFRKFKYIERFGKYFIVKRATKPTCFCFPIWAIYTTAYARLKLHEYCVRYHPIYVDTDSLVIKQFIGSSDELGGLKYEMKIKNGIIVKPKFYMFNSNPKIKGVGKKVLPDEFIYALSTGKIKYKHFLKFSECVRRGLIPNNVIDMLKEFNLEDDKRFWKELFDYNDFQMSKPIEVIDGIPESKYTLKHEYPMVMQE